MSVIVARSSERGAGGAPPVTTTNAFPAVTTYASVPVSSTVTIDSVPTAMFRAVKWYVVVTNVANTRSEAYEVFAAHRNGINPTNNQYAMVGDSLSVVPSVAIVAGQLILQMTNSDSETFNVYVTRLSIPISNTATNSTTMVEIGNAHALVGAGATGIIDFVNIVSTLGVKWVVTATDSVGNKSTSQIIFLMNSTGGTQVTYGTIGSNSVDYTLGITEVVGLGTELTLNNLGISALKVDVTRIPIQSSPLTPTTGMVSGLALWLPPPITIGAGLTANVDSTVAIPAHSAIKWLVGINESVAGTATAGELMTNYQLGPSTTSDLWYSLVADSLNVVVSTSLVGGNIILSITNNEINPITVNLLRIPTSM